MVPGSGRRVAPWLIACVLALLFASACAPAPGTETTGTSDQNTTSLPPSSTTATSVVAAVTTTTPTTISDVDIEVALPEGEGPFPVVVLVHGGGWVGGSPDLMRDLARFLTEEGYLTVNAAYTLANGTAGFPVAVDDIACAVRRAAEHPDGDGTVAVIGHSSGAHLAALVALDEGGVYGEGCASTQPFIPDRLVGLAGPYDVARLGPLIFPFFGIRPNEDPEIWQAGNPMNQAGNNLGLSSLIMHGEEDALIDLSFATDFVDALTEAGSEALVEVVEGARHNAMHDPDIVGDLIVAWLERR